MATLVISHPMHGRMEYPLITDDISIGRMNDNTIQIRDDSVSGRHARITRKEGNFHLEDLGSANRCFLEGKEVSEVDLTRDCTLRFGNVNCEFLLHANVPDSIAGQFFHFQKQIQSILADRNEALRKCEDAVAERDQLEKRLKSARANQLDSGTSTKDQGRDMRKVPVASVMTAKQLDLEKFGLQPEHWNMSGRSQNLSRKDFDAILDDLQATKADATALRKKEIESNSRAELLARQVESVIVQRDELQRSNDQLNAELEEAQRTIESLASRIEKTALQHEESHAELRQFVADAEMALSRLARVTKNLSSAGTATCLSDTPFPSASASHSSNRESSDLFQAASSPSPVKDFAQERTIRSIEPTSIPETPSSSRAHAVSPDQIGVSATGEETIEKRQIPQFDPSPAISPAVLAGRGFTPGWRNVIHPIVADMRRLFVSFSENRRDLAPLDEILRDAYNLTHRTASIDCNALFNLASALEALIRDVHHTPDRITGSVLKTIAEALDLLELMLDEKHFRQAAQLPEGRTCVIEDDDEIRNAVLAAMKTVNLEPKWSPDTSQTRSFLKSRPLDLILIDPASRLKDHLDPISLIRSLPMHVNTPIIAIQEVGTHVMEGVEAISKSFNHRELAAKSLTMIFKGQLRIA